MLTRDTVIGDIATALDRPAHSITDDLDLMNEGLDSIRIMGLIERWRAAGASDIDFPMLAAEPTVGRWIAAVLGEN